MPSQSKAASFRIHCICLVKNEADIIQHCLSCAAKWADYVYVYDGDSTDGTWDLVLNMASRQIIPFRRDGKVFAEGLRAEVFANYRHLSADGDWWCQLNADEFYVDDPRTLLSEIAAPYHFVWGVPIEYYLTPRDVEELDFGVRMEHLLTRIRHYRIFHSEPRFFRYRSRLDWNEADAWPSHVGLTYSKRILFKHYPFRSPQQIQMRLDVRRENRAKGFPGWEHAKELDWKEKLVDPETTTYDDGVSGYSIDDQALPCHMDAMPRVIIKQIMHRLRIWP
ncbi:MAG: glycosyltransferase family 2 protein [Bryobacteraceae bacterium]